MSRRLACPVALVLLAFSSISLAEEGFELWPGLFMGPFEAGYQVLDTRDFSRAFGPKLSYDGSRRTGELSRPIRISIWYPAEVSAGKASLKYRDYLSHAAMETEQEPLSEETYEAALGKWKALMLRGGFQDSILERLLARDFVATYAPPPLPGPFPLILYAPSISSSPYEIAVLAEYLASHGFVIASSPSVGVSTREMDHNWEGVEAQLRDVEFVLSRMRGFPSASPNRIGAFGFSWGGLTVSRLAVRNQLIDAVACLDGGVNFGFRANTWKGYDYHQPERVRVPFLQASNRHYKKDDEWEFFGGIKYAETQQLVFHHFEHGHFSSAGCLPRLIKSNEVAHDPIVRSYTALSLYLRHFFGAHLLGDSESIVFLDRSPGRNGFSKRLLSVERHPGLASPPSEYEFLEFLGREGVDAATALYRRYAGRDPELSIWDEARMNRLGYRLMVAKRLETAIKVFELNREAYPLSWNVYDSLAEALSAKGERGLAVKYYRKALEINPDNENARTQLRRLGAKE